MARILIDKVAPEDTVNDVIAFREPYQTFYYNFDHELPLKRSHA
jgi:hypothetical protein